MSRLVLLIISVILMAYGALLVFVDIAMLPNPAGLEYLMKAARRLGQPAWSAVILWLSPLLIGAIGLMAAIRDEGRRRP